MGWRTWVLGLGCLSGCGASVPLSVDAVPEEARHCTVTIAYQDAMGTFERERYYDAEGRLLGGLTQPTYTSESRSHLRYDASGRLVEVLAQNDAQAESFPCDAIGGCDTPATRTIDRMRFLYDPIGRIMRVEHDTLRTSSEFDRTESRSWKVHYDPEGRLETVDFGRGTLRYEYDDAGRLVSRRNERRDGRYTLVLERDATGRVVREKTQSCAEICGEWRATNIAYDALGRVASRTPVPDEPRDMVSVGRYAYDAGGRVLESARDDVVSGVVKRTVRLEYTYDAHGRFLTAGQDGRVHSRWSYEPTCPATLQQLALAPDEGHERFCWNLPGSSGRVCTP